MPFLPAIAMTAVLYIGLRWAQHANEGPAVKPPPSIADLAGELSRLVNNPRLMNCRNDLINLLDTVNSGMLAVGANEPALQDLTRIALTDALRYTKNFVALPIPPGQQDTVAINYKKLLVEYAEQLSLSYGLTGKQDAEALAQQIQSSTTALKEVRQQITSGEL
jgi:hypothetical protein